MSELEQLRAKIIKAIPEIVESNYVDEITCRPITSEDIILTIKKIGLPAGYLFFNLNYRGNFELSGIGERIYIPWVLGQPLDQQSPETIKALNELI